MNADHAVQLAVMRAKAHKKDFAVVLVGGEIDVRTHKHAVSRGYEILEVVRCQK